MPKYDPVPSTPQLPARAAPRKEEVALTVDIPADVRRRFSIACAVHDVKLKAAVAEALTDWLEKHPPAL